MTGKKVRKKWRKPIREIREMYKSKFLRAAVAPLMAALVGCGGGSLDNELPLVQEQALTVEGRIASSAEAASEFSGIRKRNSTHPASLPAKVRLPRMIVPKGSIDEDSGRYKISASREVTATNTAGKTNQHLNWRPAANGAQVAAVSFTSTDAYGVRLGLLVRALPGSARLSVYSQEDPGTIYQISGQEILQRIQTNLSVGDTSDNANTWWPPVSD